MFDKSMTLLKELGLENLKNRKSKLSSLWKAEKTRDSQSACYKPTASTFRRACSGYESY